MTAKIMNNYRYLQYVKTVLERGSVVKTDERGTVRRVLLAAQTPVGLCEIMLFMDNTDGHYHDMARYRLHKFGGMTEPVLWDISTPKEVCYRFFNDVKYKLLSYGPKCPKPRELKGIAPIATVRFAKANCQIFLKDLDLYIKHGDYFSPLYCRPEDSGTTLEYRAKKYGMGDRKPIFVYSDSWGAIVMRQYGWIKVTNFVPMLLSLNDVQCGEKLCKLLQEYHKFDTIDMEWNRFFERMSRKARKKLS